MTKEQFKKATANINCNNQVAVNIGANYDAVPFVWGEKIFLGEWYGGFSIDNTNVVWREEDGVIKRQRLFSGCENPQVFASKEEALEIFLNDLWAYIEYWYVEAA